MDVTPYEGYRGIRLPPELQKERVRTVMREELTEKERVALIEYYLNGKKLKQIATEQGVNKSTAWRNLHRAEEKLRRFLRY